MRPKDEPIPPDEALYRWIATSDVNGAEVLPHAIDLARSSVNRAKYWPDPFGAAPFDAAKNGLAVTSEQVFPENIVLNEVAYEFFTVDWPEELNDAHAEIRSGRRAAPDRGDDRPDGFKPKSAAAKLELRTRLAQAMRVVRAPE